MNRISISYLYIIDRMKIPTGIKSHWSSNEKKKKYNYKIYCKWVIRMINKINKNNKDDISKYNCLSFYSSSETSDILDTYFLPMDYINCSPCTDESLVGMIGYIDLDDIIIKDRS